jgi:16S rRNA (guanine527-N7)-methyltransferase
MIQTFSVCSYVRGDPLGSSADNSDPFEALARAALAIPVTLSGSWLDRCKRYVETLLLWRQRLSLTSAATPGSVVLDHILDSLYLAPFIRPGFRVADIGSGAGFPGVPLAIVSPEAHFVLVESRRKKANFLREVARQVRLTNVEVAEQRAEVLLEDFPDLFDLVVSRAVGPVSEFLTLAAPLVGREGLVIAMKGPTAHAELAVHPGFAAAEVVEYHLPSGARHLLLVYRRQ